MLHLFQLIRPAVLRLLIFDRLTLDWRRMLVSLLLRRLLLFRMRVRFPRLLHLWYQVLFLPPRVSSLLFLGPLTWAGMTLPLKIRSSFSTA